MIILKPIIHLPIVTIPSVPYYSNFFLPNIDYYIIPVTPNDTIIPIFSSNNDPRFFIIINNIKYKITETTYQNIILPNCKRDFTDWRCWL